MLESPVYIILSMSKSSVHKKLFKFHSLPRMRVKSVNLHARVSDSTGHVNYPSNSNLVKFLLVHQSDVNDSRTIGELSSISNLRFYYDAVLIRNTNVKAISKHVCYVHR